MLKIFPLLLAALVFTSCAAVKSREMETLSGTSIIENENDRFDVVVTYVSPEEYETMTPEERKRRNVRVGKKVKLTW